MYLRSVAALAARAVQLRRAVSVAALRPDIFRRILFDPPVALLVLLQMLAVPGSTEASSTSPRRSVRVVWWGVVMLATKFGGPVGGASAYFDLCVLRMLGHVATLLLGGPVLWEPIRVPVGHERRPHSHARARALDLAVLLCGEVVQGEAGGRLQDLADPRDLRGLHLGRAASSSKSPRQA